jgi:hypothetical protein
MGRYPCLRTKVSQRICFTHGDDKLVTEVSVTRWPDADSVNKAASQAGGCDAGGEGTEDWHNRVQLEVQLVWSNLLDSASSVD